MGRNECTVHSKQEGEDNMKITKENAKHLYEVCGEIHIPMALKGYSNIRLIEVEANNRAQASSMVKKLGYEVCSVNMVG